VDADNLLAATGTGLYRFQPSTGAWTQLSTRTDVVRLDFFDVTSGFAVTADGNLVETSDGARTVSKRDAGMHPVTWVQWLSRSRAWAAGPQGIATTRDGGATWTRQLTLPDSGPDTVTWAQLGFRDTSSGFAIFDLGGQALGRQAYVVYHTSDGGANWTAASCTCGFAAVPDWLRRGAAATLPEEAHSDLLVTGPSSAMLVTSRPAPSSSVSICTTTDGGANWSCAPAPFAGAGTGALGSRGSTWWLAADSASAGPLIAVTRDNGATWTK
jgi:hypothetical protein